MASILLIDEYDGFRETMAYCLPKFGHDVLCAPDVRTAMQAAKTRRVELVLLDIGRAGIRGMQACESLCRCPVLGKTPVVIMTGYHSAAIVEGARTAGAVAVIAKPFQWAELLATIARWAPAEHR